MLLLLAACTTSPTATDTADCAPLALEATPSPVPLGAAVVGEVVTGTLTVTNPGTCAAEITGASFDPADASLTLAADPVGELDASTSVEVSIRWEPVAAEEIAASLVLATDTDPLVVPLSGTAAFATSVGVSPASVDLPETALGCESAVPVTLTAGVGGATVSAVALTGDPALTLDLDETTNGPLPWVLGPTESRTVSVTFAPTVAATGGAGTLVVTSDDRAAPEQQLPVTATATTPEEVTVSRRWNPPVDVIVALDTTASMGSSGRLDALDAAWPDLVDALLATGADYHLALVADPSGCVAGSRPYVPSSASAADQVGQLREMVAGAGDSGDTLFDTLMLATAPGLVGAGGCNEGLTRAGATLAVLGITDGSDASSVSWVEFYYALTARVSDGANVRIAAVGGDWPSGCGDVEPAEGWYEASMSAGIGLASICGDLPSTLAATGAALPEPSSLTFALPDTPLDGTLVVELDGVATSAWTYEADDNTVTLTSPPPNDTTVSIRYLPDTCPAA